MLPPLLERQLQQAFAQIVPTPSAAVELAQIRPCPDPKFGDYQCAGAMALAKQLKKNPRQLAAEIIAKLQVEPWSEPPEIAGAGFINFRLKPAAIANSLEEAARGEHLFYSKAIQPRRIVLDFSSPNVAKAMHVGHIRSTILGDSLARHLRFLGNEVIKDNHIGDWGTQFGKLIVGWKTLLDRSALRQDPIHEMERLYKTIHQACESDPALLEQARQELLKLQQGDLENLQIWREMISRSQAQFDAIYQRLGVQFDVTLGESFYNPRLNPLVAQLRQAGLARESEGAMVVFFDVIPALKNHPAIIQKSDGAANYTTTDLATLEHRIDTWQPHEIVYVTDGRQQLHFQQLFAIYRQWRPNTRVALSHVWFGSILGEDGKPFKTRSGETVRLTDLLDEAEERAWQVVSEKNPNLPPDVKKEIARVVGIGAIKYADLLPNRQSDYVFSWDKMLALTGNTAPYLQYAYTRVRSIFRKSEQEKPAPSAHRFRLGAPEELSLAKHLLNFGLVLEAVVQEYRPNYLCNFLYDLAGHFARFYEACPVLKAPEPDRSTRLALCDLTGKVLQQGLDLLGIETTELM